MTDPWGIDDGYWDAGGQWHPTSAETAAALRASMAGVGDAGDSSGAGAAADGPPPGRPLWVVGAGGTEPLLGPCELALEDGTTVRAETSLPPDVPIGYHELRPLDGGPVTRLIVTPGRCHLPGDLRGWLLTVQLPGCRSSGSWGIGDLADLRALGAWAAERGAAMLAVSPLHAPRTAGPDPDAPPVGGAGRHLTGAIEASPYFPSSRRWCNPLLLRIDELPGAGDPAIEALATEARRLNSAPLVDRDATWTCKRQALDHLWGTLGPDLRFERWRDEAGAELETYARFCALADHHRSGWTSWPAEHRHPSRPGVASFASAHPDRVTFWAWIQFLLDEQLRKAGEPVPLLADLAVGVDPDGADAWALQDLLATGVRVGAPPDEFNRAGQDWGLPPFVPHALRDAGYEPLASLWRAAMRSAGADGGLRLDHVMGLFRLFWLPPGGSPTDGAYVRYPADELLAVLAVESVRAGAVVVGEDLGTVEEGVRERLGDAGVMSYRLVWFEEAPPDDYPPQALAAVSTHDLPTIAGVWSGDDAADQRAAGIEPDEAALGRLRDKLVTLTGVAADAPVEDVIVAAHRRLAGSPCALVGATLEDALALRLRPNLPGTTDERHNWSVALPLPLEEALDDPLLGQVAEVLAR
jgi:4-alpha-glucanotransferase